jgi:hypothetical protein
MFHPGIHIKASTTKSANCKVRRHDSFLETDDFPQISAFGSRQLRNVVGCPSAKLSQQIEDQ